MQRPPRRSSAVSPTTRSATSRRTDSMGDPWSPPIVTPPRPTGRRDLRRITDRRLSRRSRWQLAGLLGLAGLVGLMARSISAADGERAAWGTRVSAVVAVSEIEPGAVVTASDVETVELPAAAVPEGAADVVPADIVGRATARHVLPGDVLSPDRLAPSGVSGIAAAVPTTRRAVALPRSATTPEVRPGDVVDLVGVPDAGSRSWSAERAGGVVVATGVVVLAVDTASITVSVSAGSTPEVVAAAAADRIVAVLTGRGPPDDDGGR